MKRLIIGILALTIVASYLQADEALEFVMNNGAESLTLDPSMIESGAEQKVYMALFEGLVGYDPKTALAVPGIAESWKISPDGARVTFRLREAYFSDGTRISAQTVVDSWLRTLDPNTASNYAFMIGMIIRGAEDFNSGKSRRSSVAIRAIDDSTFQCDLVGPLPYAVDMMAHHAFAILPMHLIDAMGDAWCEPGNIVGNGPFTLAEARADQSLELIRNPLYWDASSVRITKLTILPNDNYMSAYKRYTAGDIDWMYGIPLNLIGEIRTRPDYHVYPMIATYYYIFNITRAPFQDVRVRKALALAIDRDELVEKVTQGGQIATTSLIPPMAGYIPPTGLGFDVAESRRLLAEAGFPGGNGFPKVPILYNTNQGHKRIAEYVRESWKRNLGIDVYLIEKDWRAFLDERSTSHDFFIGRAGWVGDYLDPSTFLDMFIIGSGNNDGLYANNLYDSLVQKAATMKAGPERMEILRRAETLLVERDCAVIPFYHYVEQDLIDLTKWDGWYPNPLGVHEWKYIRPKNP